MRLGYGLGFGQFITRPLQFGQSGGPPALIPSALTSTITATPSAIDGDGADASEIEAILRTAAGVPVPDIEVTDSSVVRQLVDADESTLEALQAEILNDGTVSNIVGHLYDAVTGAPVPGVTPTLASTGSNNTITPVDAVTDKNGRFRWTFSSTTVQLKTLTMTYNRLTIVETAQVNVTGPPAPQPAFVFTSDFSTATGTSDDARRDTGQVVPWDSIDNPASPEQFEVLAASGVTLTNGGVTLASRGWPSTNALRNIIHAGSATLTVNDKWAHIGVGESIWLRWYFCHDGADSAGGQENDNSFHSPQCGPAGEPPHTWAVSYNNRGLGGVADGTFHFTFRNSAGTPIYRFRGPFLQKGQVYWVSVQITRTGENTLGFNVDIYDANDELVASAGDFTMHASPFTPMNEVTTIPYPAGSVAGEFLRGLMGGCNQGGMPLGVNIYHGAFAVSLEGPCGPYNVGESP